MSVAQKPRQSLVTKDWVGKRVYWESKVDEVGGACKINIGTLENVKGNNAVIDGEYWWLPYMKNLRLATPEDSLVVPSSEGATMVSKFSSVKP